MYLLEREREDGKEVRFSKGDYFFNMLILASMREGTGATFSSSKFRVRVARPVTGSYRGRLFSSSEKSLLLLLLFSSWARFNVGLSGNNT